MLYVSIIDGDQLFNACVICELSKSYLRYLRWFAAAGLSDQYQGLEFLQQV